MTADFRFYDRLPAALWYLCFSRGKCAQFAVFFGQSRKLGQVCEKFHLYSKCPSKCLSLATFQGQFESPQVATFWFINSRPMKCQKMNDFFRSPGLKGLNTRRLDFKKSYFWVISSKLIALDTVSSKISTFLKNIVI